jgi:uncharacterized membrane protein YfcA
VQTYAAVKGCAAIVLAVFAMLLLWFGGIGAVTPETPRLFIFGLPAVLVGTWLGFRLNGKLNEAVFRIMLPWASGARFCCEQLLRSQDC